MPTEFSLSLDRTPPPYKQTDYDQLLKAKLVEDRVTVMACLRKSKKVELEVETVFNTPSQPARNDEF